MFSMICAWINGWVNNREAGDLRRRRAHYDFIVMNFVMRHISLLMHISIYDICAKYGVLWSVMIWQTMAFDYMLHTSPSKCKTTCTSHFTFDAVAWRPVAWFICDAFEILWNAGYWMGLRHMYRVLFDNTCTMLRSNPYSPSELFSYCFWSIGGSLLTAMIHYGFSTWDFACEWTLLQWIQGQYLSMICNHCHCCWSLQWRQNGCNGVSNHQPQHCLFNRLFRRKWKKTSKLRVTGLCVRNSPVTGEFPVQMASNPENVSFWWRHHYSLATR